MKIEKSFTVSRSPEAVWRLFQDIPVVASCMPGAEFISDKGQGEYVGKVTVKLGPFGASFEGTAKVTANDAAKGGRVEAQGLDRRGGSRSKLTMLYRIEDAGGGARVHIDADVQLSGPIAQFGRVGVVTETANVLIGQFARNVEEKLASTEPSDPQTEALAGPMHAAPGGRRTESASKELNVFTLLWALIASMFRRRGDSTAGRD